MFSSLFWLFQVASLCVGRAGACVVAVRLWKQWGACALMIPCHKLHGHWSHTNNPRNTSGLTVQKKPNCPLLNDAVSFVLTYVEVMVKLCMVFYFDKVFMFELLPQKQTACNEEDLQCLTAASLLLVILLVLSKWNTLAHTHKYTCVSASISADRGERPRDCQECLFILSSCFFLNNAWQCVLMLF